MINIKELKSIQYDYNYDITEKEVEKANNYIELMRKERESTDKPVAGDIVKFTNKYGDYYEMAHIDQVFDDEVYICESAYIPFIHIRRDEKIGFSTSGGSWCYRDFKNFKKIETSNKMFCDWRK